jgi:exodeoxyribonuclease VII small subunit
MNVKSKAKASPLAPEGLPTPEDGLLDLSFEQAMAELEGTVKRLEGGDLPLAESLAAFHRGSALLRHAQGILNQVQTEIELIEADQETAVDRASLISQIKD